ncbi:hypothetical protein BGW42_008087 [Actinomortierella wolfii]|nr:hypothetical protein BGW42_008087 [Actinomortierella wolfii]
MYLSKQTTFVLLSLALNAVGTIAQSPTPPPDDNACVTCLTTSGKTLPECANVPIPYPIKPETLMTLTPEQRVCACALSSSLDWTNTCNTTCSERTLTDVRQTLSVAGVILCKDKPTGPSVTSAPSPSTTSNAQPSPSSNVNGGDSKTPGSSASTTVASLAASALIVLLASAHAF